MPAYGEQVRLMDTSKRYVRKDGVMCVAVATAEGKDIMDLSFQHETRLMDEVSRIVKRSLTVSDHAIPSDDSQRLAISDDTQALIVSSVSQNTLRSYRFWSREIEAWLSGRSLDDGLLAEYITGLHAQGKSPATIGQAVAAVRWQAKNTSPQSPPQAGGRVERLLGDHLTSPVGEITTRALAGIRREGKDRGRGQVGGLTWSDVERICVYAEMDKSIAGLRDSALIRLMSDCLLRISEVVAVNVGDLKDRTLVVRSSKTDQEGVGETLYVTSDTRRIIKRYREKGGISRGALFRQVRKGGHIQTGRLSARSARQRITYWAKLAGVEGFISGHSLRVGSAVSLAQAGASVVDMQVAGRWKSSQMPAHYAKAELAERGAIARFKERKGVK